VDSLLPRDLSLKNYPIAAITACNIREKMAGIIEI
jgi:hypothetical protein